MSEKRLQLNPTVTVDYTPALPEPEWNAAFEEAYPGLRFLGIKFRYGLNVITNYGEDGTCDSIGASDDGAPVPIVHLETDTENYVFEGTLELEADEPTVIFSVNDQNWHYPLPPEVAEKMNGSDIIFDIIDRVNPVFYEKKPIGTRE